MTRMYVLNTASVCLCVGIYLCSVHVCVLASVVLCCRPLSSLSQCHQLLRQPGGSMKASERRPRERVRWSMAQSRLAAAVEQHWDAVHVLWVWVRDCTSVCVCGPVYQHIIIHQILYFRKKSFLKKKKEKKNPSSAINIQWCICK